MALRRSARSRTAPSADEPSPPPAAAPHVPRSFWPSFPPRHYLGQLQPHFQAALAAERADLTRDDCDWYHTAVLRSGEVIPGAWDLRGGEENYLGGTDVAGQRVLEFGPATGYLTYWMEDQGADVVCVDAGFDVSIDILPVPGNDLREIRMGAMRGIGAVQNSWWYLHHERQSKASTVYAPIYDLPADIGMFDVTTFGAILLHLRDPFSALAQGAIHTHRRIIVTDLIQDTDVDPDQNVMRPDPLGALEHRTNWWAIFPGAVRQMLKRVGFTETQTFFHTQKHHLGHRLDEPPTEMTMFTVVADRPAA
ncbi:MAG TPA: hypothetical protein VM345_08845 [Acidimicrobiales bacterium]|jgi:hypothetical protein|nr:hypothetical protein [Acidimicrobiales bacterium]